MRNLEVHVDDMVIKNDLEEDMLVDFQETFDKLWAINMKLNPGKCSFGVEKGPFLGKKIVQCPNQRRNPGNVSSSLRRKYQCSFTSRKRKEANPHLFHKPSTKRGRNRVSVAGKTHTSPRIRCKKAPVLYTNEASSSDLSGAGMILVNPEGREYTYALKFECETTNNEAEYEALLAGL
ncbi:reverse transcriptase domain-containing protein [Tanacetum coccineum]